MGPPVDTIVTQLKKKVAPCPGSNLTEYDDFGLLSVTVVFLMLKVVNGHN